MMIEEIGTVKSLSGSMAVVLVPRKSACEGCTAGACRPDEQAMEIEAENRAGAEVGQRVKVAIEPSAYMKGSLIVYGVPALALVVGAVAGKEWVSRLLPGRDPDILSAIVGFAALVFALGLIRLWSRSASGKDSARPVIEEILR